MSFYQNPFTATYKGSWPLRSPINGKQQSMILEGTGNSGRGDDLVMSWAGVGPFDFSGNDAEGDPTRYLSFKFTSNFIHWSIYQFDLGTGSTTTVAGIVGTLNNNANFSNFWVASIQNGVLIVRQKLPVGRFKFFVMNGGAETLLKFNGRAGVFELPDYFARHIVGGTAPDCLHALVRLDESNDVDAAVIEDAVDSKGNSLHYDADEIKEDWEFLEGSSGIFQFKKQTVDGSNRVTAIISYPAGSGVGDLAVKTIYTYSGANTSPSEIFDLPYTLESGDLITPA